MHAQLFSELLLALVGNTGEAFERRDRMITLNEALVDWVPPPERWVARTPLPVQFSTLPPPPARAGGTS